MKLFGTSGIRRLADRNLLELSVKVGLAVGQRYASVVVGTDTRTSGDAIKYAFVSGLLMAGTKCVDIGVAPTPTVARAAGKFQAGAMITASHNPPEYNGIKLFNSDGSAFDLEQQRQLEELIQGDSLHAAQWSNITNIERFDGAVQEHICHITQRVSLKKPLKVALDCGGGAASVITPILLKRMGCEVVELNCVPTGAFPRPSEPNEASLGSLIKLTRDSGADIGIAHDGDADRMMAVDDKGRFIPGDKLLALFAKQEKAKALITTMDASMTADELGLKVLRTPVGDSFVSDALKRGGDFGGEPSGAWIFPGNSLCPDGIFAAARLLEIASKNKLSSLVDEIPHYPILRGSVPSEGITLADVEGSLPIAEALSVDRSDGIRMAFADGWLLVRASGTEPRIRVTAEGKNEAVAQHLCDAGMKIIKDCVMKKKGKSE